MLKNYSPQAPLTIRRVALLAAVAVVPMAIAFAAQAPPSNNRSRSDDRQSIEQPAVQRRAINRLVKDFPAKSDLSTPESAQAAWNRASARMDDQAVLELSWVKWGPRDIENMERYRQSNPRETEVYNQAQLNAEILEVATYRGDCAVVISKLSFPEGVGRNPYSIRSFGRINGVWKNLGEDRQPSLEAAREDFNRKKDALWQEFVNQRDRIIISIENVAGFPRKKVEKPVNAGTAEGMKELVEDFFGKNFRDITSRETIEWGDLAKADKGNSSIRYKYRAKMWDKDAKIMNQVFTFDPQGKFVSVKDVAGFPQNQ
jgi:hypothetical protein